MRFAKCMMCEKFATFYITDIVHGKPRESYFCDDHGREQMGPSVDSSQFPVTGDPNASKRQLEADLHQMEIERLADPSKYPPTNDPYEAIRRIEEEVRQLENKYGPLFTDDDFSIDRLDPEG